MLMQVRCNPASMHKERASSPGSDWHCSSWERTQLGAHLLHLEAEPEALEEKCSFDYRGLVLVSTARIREKSKWLSDRNSEVQAGLNSGLLRVFIMR